MKQGDTGFQLVRMARDAHVLGLPHFACRRGGFRGMLSAVETNRERDLCRKRASTRGVATVLRHVMLPHTNIVRGGENMSFSEVEVGSGMCVYFEQGTTSEDAVDESQWAEGGLLPCGGGNCICGHTGRTTGPDYRAVSKKACDRTRMCFKPRGHF